MKKATLASSLTTLGFFASLCLLTTACLDPDGDIHPEDDAIRTVPPGTSPVLQALGSAISCRAPEREEYIEDNRDTSIGDDEVDTEAREHSILFVFDRSGSMNDWWDSRTKWEAAAEAMLEIVRRYQSYVTAGAIFYPSFECDVSAIESDDQIDFTDAGDFLSQWEQKTNDYRPGGGTPMNRAFEEADRAIARACEDGLMEQPLRVVVLTDGEPNCDLDVERLVHYPAKWRELGVKTYVIGLPGFGAHQLLNDIAAAGDTLPEAPDTDADSDGAIDAEWDTDGDGIIDTDFDTDGVMESETVNDLADHLILAIE